MPQAAHVFIYLGNTAKKRINGDKKIIKYKKHTQYAFYVIFFNYLLNLGKEKAATTALMPTRE